MMRVWSRQSPTWSLRSRCYARRWPEPSGARHMEDRSFLGAKRLTEDETQSWATIRIGDGIMASKRRKRLSVWGVLARLGHTGDHDDIIQHVFEATSRVTLRSRDGKTLDGDSYLCAVFDSLGSTHNWPACGSDAWERLRLVALRRVIARLAREGLLDCIAVAPTTRAIPKD